MSNLLQIWVRARIHATRSKGKTAFLVLRHRVHTAQVRYQSIFVELLDFSGILEGRSRNFRGTHLLQLLWYQNMLCEYFRDVMSVHLHVYNVFFINY